MNRVKGFLAIALPLAGGFATQAEAANFVKYTMSGTFSGTRVTQAANALGASEAVSGVATFEYVLPLSVVAQAGTDMTYFAKSGYFLGAVGEWTVKSSVVSFFERGFGNAGVANYLSASACLPGVGVDLTAYSGASDSKCGEAVIRDTERGMVLDLRGTIDSFSAQVVDGTSPGAGLSNYSVSVAAAVPEPATWAMMFLGFTMIGATLRYRRRATKVAYA